MGMTTDEQVKAWQEAARLEPAVAAHADTKPKNMAVAPLMLIKLERLGFEGPWDVRMDFHVPGDDDAWVYALGSRLEDGDAVKLMIRVRDMICEHFGEDLIVPTPSNQGK